MWTWNLTDDLEKQYLRHLFYAPSSFVHHFVAICKFQPHWGHVTHKCVSKIIIIGSNNGLLPGRRQAIICTNAGILLIGPSGTNFSEILIEIHTFSCNFKNMHMKLSSVKWRPFCLGLNVLSQVGQMDRHADALRETAPSHVGLLNGPLNDTSKTMASFV